MTDLIYFKCISCIEVPQLIAGDAMEGRELTFCQQEIDMCSGGAVALEENESKPGSGRPRAGRKGTNEKAPRNRDAFEIRMEAAQAR